MVDIIPATVGLPIVMSGTVAMTPVKTSAAYLLFYKSLQNVRVLLLVPMVLLFCGVRLGVGGGMLCGKGWRIDAWPVVGVLDGDSPAGECGLSKALVLSLYFPYSFFSCASHTHRTNCLPPILPVPLCAPYFPQ